MVENTNATETHSNPENFPSTEENTSKRATPTRRKRNVVIVSPEEVPLIRQKKSKLRQDNEDIANLIASPNRPSRRSFSPIVTKL